MEAVDLECISKTEKSGRVVQTAKRKTQPRGRDVADIGPFATF